MQDRKDFSRIDASDEWHWADLQQGIDSTLNIVWNELKYKVEVKKKYADIPEEDIGVITIRTGQDGIVHQSGRVLGNGGSGRINVT